MKLSEQLQGGGAFLIDDFELMDAQHDGNHHTNVGLIVNNKRGASRPPGSVDLMKTTVSAVPRHYSAGR
jgi:hypothetical protein